MLEDNNIDITGWDLRKTLRLLWKSNPPLLERIQSPILYQYDAKFLKGITALATQTYSKIATMHHYLNMARKSYAEVSHDNTFKLKKFFYALRTATACYWILEREEIPPIEFKKMIDSLPIDCSITNRIEELIALKQTQNESYLHQGESELMHFIELLSVNNPNILELLSSPASAVLYRHPFLDAIQPEMFLSKLCQNTFGKFALAQIKKAKGLNKKIVNPVGRERKSVLSFCFVNDKKGAIPLLQYLSLHDWKQEHCGLVNIPHMKNMYGLYHSDQELYHGIVKSDDSNDVSLSSIPKEEEQQALLYFNKDGYSSYCKEYKEYWEWVEKRNDARYATTVSQNYDTKNMMHTFRLLDTAIEIGRDHAVNVQRPNRDFLLKIRSGTYEYDELLAMADERKRAMEEAFEHSTLPDTPDLQNINHLAYEIRDKLYALE